MNELTILLSDTQKQRLQETIHQLLENEVTQFQIDLGLNNRYLKKNQLCQYLNLSNNTIDKLIVEGLPRININGIVLYDKLEIDKWLKKHIQLA
ncbi:MULTISPECIES: helix-turn-helix transcriptional regulator [Carnobacterium]|uniref:helix-turn-helix transcriptional regulator n=1 Tax=Carnobacterium TaxID=2747 RepID=UPI00288CAF97|nr:MULTISPECIES: helix-turn-helix domain-containing protein [Carnobacterium]MDT1939618.1 helix-turn-helix domain-containing protein [Carnobacterium divergens]MDT1942056.1 helix-turn-helix domain-containing protein [Carnobacterium divergens]MDT1947854.1 helix-turn-helix domain-containing protein [Carnobacterium divergens]MDT1950342.1 helix-turn-helix domain-containing protein [Carnobacterium divergens]MDT1955520.1 helix-turn-helix domain-containing protein [Carnobacterium divergens]